MDSMLLMHGTTIKINGTEISGSIQRGEFTDSLSDYQLLKKESGLWFTATFCQRNGCHFIKICSSYATEKINAG